MNKTNLIIFILLVFLGGLVIAIYFQSQTVSEQLPLDVQPVPAREPVKNPIVHYPVPDSTTTPAVLPPEQKDTKTESVDQQLSETTPSVQKNDKNFQAALTNSLSSQTDNKLLQMENFIQRFVVTIDNLPEKRLPRAHLPLKAPGGKFLVAGTPEAPQASSRNYKRYSIYVTLLESIDRDLTIKFYAYFYPLFQTAYEQLGYKNAYFNDRLVYVIDHLLTVPNPPDPIQFAQPSVLFTYADPTLENLSSGQKILLRLGSDQRVKVLNILKSYRGKLTSLNP